MWIIKIGGGASLNLLGIVRGLHKIPEPYIVVHGANNLRDELGQKLGVNQETVTSISGYSSVLTHEGTIDLQMMVYAGLRNKRLVEMCQQEGINALGLSGLDGGLIRARRNTGIKIMDHGKKRIIRDLSGKPEALNTDLIETLLEKGYIPLITVPLLDENGFAVNSENDDVVALLQKELKAATVLSFIEAKGLLERPENADSLVPRLTPDELVGWQDRTSGRMKRKLMSLVKLFSHGARKALLADGRIEDPVGAALAGQGTVIE